MKKQAHEYLFPYSGPWNILWVIQRYFKVSVKCFTVKKIFNAMLALMEMKFGIFHVKSKPFVLRIEACNYCNLKCPLCACGMGWDKRPKGMVSIDDYVSVLEQNKKYAIIARLDGMGEPTLHPEFFKLIQIAKNYGLSVTVHSNFTTEACKDAASLVDSGLDRIVISIDGATEKSYQKYRVGGTLKSVVDNITNLVEEKKRRNVKHPIVEAQFILFDHNKKEIEETRNLALSIGCDKFEISAPDSAAKSHQTDYSKPKRCFWLWSVLVVGWDMSYRPCNNAWSYNWPKLNMKNCSGDRYWNHLKMIEARKYNVNKKSDMIENDKDCKCSKCFEMQVIPLEGDYSCE